jgi:hypothetical protein
MIKKIFYLYLAIFSTSILAMEENSCKSSQNTFDFSDFSRIIDNLSYPKMKMKYSLSPGCEYNLESKVTFPAKGKSPVDVIRSMLEPANNLASANRDILLKQTLTSSGQSFKQVSTVTKNYVQVNVITNCNMGLVTSAEAKLNCVVDEKNSKSNGMITIKPFQYNSSSTTCKPNVLDKSLVDCVFKTTGKASSLPLKSSCSLAAGGAVETFESIYRLTHFLTHGNVKNISRGKTVVDRFYKRASTASGIGSKTIQIEENIP